MPHQIIEYSSNLDAELDIDELINVLHQVAANIDALPVAGLRTRAVRREHYRIADGHLQNTFLHVVLRIAHGRSLEVKQAAGNAIFEALCAHLKAVYEQIPMAISFEMQEIDPDFRWKKNNLREYLISRDQNQS